MAKQVLRKVPQQVFTVEWCPNCGLKSKRAFQKGDVLYKEGGECASCKHRMIISMIYAEQVKPT
jgi:hypothetical protein